MQINPYLHALQRDCAADAADDTADDAADYLRRTGFESNRRLNVFVWRENFVRHLPPSLFTLKQVSLVIWNIFCRQHEFMGG